MESTNSTKVSVVVLTYNSSDYIAETLKSVLNQDFFDMELIVGDDASSDNTIAIIESIRSVSNIPIKLLVNNKNMGISANFNRCLDYCSGEYVFLLGGDDVFLPGKIKEQVRFMDENKDIFISYHDVSVFDSDSDKHIYYYNKDRHGFHSGGADILVTQGTFNCGCATAVRNINLPRCDLDIKYSSDWLWYIDILGVSGKKIGWFPGVYAKYRRHSNNITTKSSVDVQCREVMLTIKIVRDRYPILNGCCDIAYCERFFVFSIKYFFSGDYLKALIAFSEPLMTIRGLYYYIKRRVFRKVC